MAVSYLYNNTNVTLDNIYLATGGGTSFSANLAGSATMDYFNDASVVDDAIYFGDASTFSDLLFDVGTQLVADAIIAVWEYYDDVTEDWITLEQCTDNTNAFQTAGANTVVFPLQYNWKSTAVNSITKYWIRCRIAAITNITEGGANQNTAVYAKDGIIKFSGTTSEDMANLSDLYDWMTANHPEVEMERISFGDTAYIIPRSIIFTDSSGQYFEMNREILFLQHEDIYTRLGLHYQGWWHITDSVIIISGQNTGNYIQLVGYVITRSQIFAGGNVRFHGGTLTDVNIRGLSDASTLRSFQGGGTITRTYIMPYQALGEFTATIDDSEFEDSILLTYGYNFTATRSRFDEPFGNLYLVRSNYTPTYILEDNPSTLPELDTGNLIGRGVDTLTGTAICYFYDDSEETYTNYTTQANSVAAGDVPLSGDVGDILYIGSAHVYWAFNHARGQGLLITMDEVNTDYVYIYEYWNGSAWVETPLSEELLTSWGSYVGYDQTKHLTQSGLVVFSDTDLGTGQTTVNGQTAYWLRIRITTKGTGTPTASQFVIRADTGVGFWNFYEKYSVDVNVKNANGDVIEGATVTITDSDGVEQFSGSTDVSGNITQQKLILKHVYFDPFNEESLTTYSYMVQKTYGNYTITLSKSGYKSQTHKITMDEKKDLVFTLEKVKDLNFSKHAIFSTQ